MIPGPSANPAPLWVHRTPARSWIGPLDVAAPAQGRPGDELARNWEVLLVLLRCDFRARYRAQALGAVWSIAHPLVMMGILSLVFTRVWSAHTPHFPIFLLVGLLVWQWVSTSLNAAAQSFVHHAELVKRTVFRREILPLATVLSHGVNFALESLLLLAFVPIFPGAFRLSWTLLLAPVLVLILALLLAGVALACSVLNVIYRDVAYLVSTGLLLLYWLTPVIYPLTVVPEPWQQLLTVGNPLAAILTALRGAVMLGQWPSPRLWLGALAPTVVSLAAGWAIFRRYERRLLDHV